MQLQPTANKAGGRKRQTGRRGGTDGEREGGGGGEGGQKDRRTCLWWWQTPTADDACAVFGYFNPNNLCSAASLSRAARLGDKHA